METEKKIFIERTDTLELVVDRIIKSRAHVVILNIPKNAAIASSINSFQVLKREGDTAGKELIIESVDDHVLELAGLARLRALNPVFRVRERAVTDILPRPKIPVLHAAVENVDKEEITIQEKNKKILEKSKKDPVPTFLKPRTSTLAKVEEPRPVKKARRGRKWLWIFAGIVLLGGGIIFAVTALPEARITLFFKTVPVSFTTQVRADSAVVSESIGRGTIALPGELLSARKNLTLSFPARGTEQVAEKAHGTLVVYNGYDANPQVLVATTRFESPEGKIFRLNERVTIPGARVVNGSVTPSSLEVAVTADQPGEAYNVGTSTGWKIPGFKGTPRYDKFYAEARTPMRGGYVGVGAKPTDDDITSAKQSAENTLRNALQGELAILHSTQFKLFEEASSFKILHEDVVLGGTKEGTFDLFIEGEMKQMVFDESMAKHAFEDLALQSADSDILLRARTNTFSYGKPVVDFAKGTMSFAASGTIVFAPAFDEGAFKRSVVGEDEQALQKRILSIPGLLRVNVSLSPFWVTHVPRNLEKITLTIQ